MSETMVVKTNNEYFKFFGQAFTGKLIKRRHKDDDVVCIQEDCGCTHWIDCSWLKEVDASCSH